MDMYDVSPDPTDCFALLCRLSRKIPSASRARAPMETPTPIPALAPVLSPGEGLGVGEGVGDAVDAFEDDCADDCEDDCADDCDERCAVDCEAASINEPTSSGSSVWPPGIGSITTCLFAESSNFPGSVGEFHGLLRSMCN